MGAPSSIPWFPRMIVLPRHLMLAALVPLLALFPTPLEAQDAVGTSIAFSPYAGIGPIIDHGSLVSWSGNAFLEIDVTHASLRLSVARQLSLWGSRA